jgi:hypothetical protein
MDTLDSSGLSLTLGQWDGGSRQLIAIASTPTEAIEIALSGLVTIYRGESGESEEETTTALAFRAEGIDVSAMVRRVAEALIDDIDHEAYDIRAVQFNGFVRTDDGFAGWGYGLATEGGLKRPGLTIADIEVKTSLHRTSVTMTVRRD